LSRLDAIRSAITLIEPLDPLQQDVAECYGQGEFSYMTTVLEATAVEDSLFVFIIKEIQDAKGNREEAARMLDKAVYQLNDVARQIGKPPGSGMMPLDLF